MSGPCTNQTPRWFTGHWREWHRGHGCDQDDGKPRSAHAASEIAKRAAVDADRSTGFYVSVAWRDGKAALRIKCGQCGAAIVPAVISLEEKLIEHSASCSISQTGVRKTVLSPGRCCALGCEQTYEIRQGIHLPFCAEHMKDEALCRAWMEL